jgi:anti-sigma factor RsiW
MAKAPIAVLLLPRRVEELEDRAEVEALLRAPGVVAIEPGLLRPAQGGRRARAQARRLLSRLPGKPVAVVVFGERERALGEALAERVLGDCEVIAAREPAGLRERFVRLGVW